MVCVKSGSPRPISQTAAPYLLAVGMFLGGTSSVAIQDAKALLVQTPHHPTLQAALVSLSSGVSHEALVASDQVSLKLDDVSLPRQRPFPDRSRLYDAAFQAEPVLDQLHGRNAYFNAWVARHKPSDKAMPAALTSTVEPVFTQGTRAHPAMEFASLNVRFQSSSVLASAQIDRHALGHKPGAFSAQFVPPLPQTRQTVLASIVVPPASRPKTVEFAALKVSEDAVKAPVKPSYLMALAPSRPSLAETDAQKQISKFVNNSAQRNCLARAIYFEARGESRQGQVGVAQVVMNRVNHEEFPSTICAVVYQNKHKRNRCQFSFACDGKRDRVRDRRAWKTALEVADDVLKGEENIARLTKATHYHATYVRPRWSRKMIRLKRIGTHIFYRGKYGGWS
jgi:spore germination cell wall hydrolase CwlJ-like protein